MRQTRPNSLKWENFGYSEASTHTLKVAQGNSKDKGLFSCQREKTQRKLSQTERGRSDTPALQIWQQMTQTSLRKAPLSHPFSASYSPFHCLLLCWFFYYSYAHYPHSPLFLGIKRCTATPEWNISHSATERHGIKPLSDGFLCLGI